MTLVKEKSKQRKRDLGFQLILLAWPVLQFCIFYIGVNFNSVLLAFTQDGKFTGYYFQNIFSSTESAGLWGAAWRSVELYLITSVISIPLSLLFAYYISKKFWGGKWFKFFLFLPSIISAMVMIALIKIFADMALPNLIGDIRYNTTGSDEIVESILSPNKNSYPAIIAVYVFLNFGTTTLLYANKMSEISPEVMEAAELDGFSQWKEFLHIVLPSVWPTLTTFLITGVATIFVNQYNLFSLFGGSYPYDSYGTVGYYIYRSIQDAAASNQFDAPIFHQIAALGLLCTAVTIPTVFLLRYLLEHFGPSER